MRNRGYPEPAAVPGARWLELGKGRFALVDEQDFAELGRYLWSRSSSNGRHAASRRVSSNPHKFEKLHQAVMALVLGCPLPPGTSIDHRDGDPLNCRRENLRIATPTQQSVNRRSARSATGYRGVSKHGNRYIAKIRLGVRAPRHLGSFKTPEEAARAYDHAARMAFQSFSRLNFPMDHEQPTGDPRTPLCDEAGYLRCA